MEAKRKKEQATNDKKKIAVVVCMGLFFFCSRSATKSDLVLFYLTWVKKVDAALLNEHLQSWLFA